MKLREEQIVEICRLYTENRVTSSELGDMFEVNKSAILYHLKKNNIKIRGNKLEIFNGDKFGRLTVIEEINLEGTSRYFLCKCDCKLETIKVFKLSSLKNGHTKSCGCLKKEEDSVRENSIGKTYGRLTIIGEIETPKNNTRKIMAQCSCNGNIKEYFLSSLKNGNTTSCGCYNKEILKNNSINVNEYQERYPLFCQVEEIRDYKNGPGIEVRCKKCRKWFRPTKSQINSRIAAIEKSIYSLGTENHLYCSLDCKNNCDVYYSHNTPKSLRNVKKQSRCNQSINKKALLQLQIDECGYNYCEKCGRTFEGKDLIIHHNIMVSKNHKMSDDMSHQILVCKEHHKHESC